MEAYSPPPFVPKKKPFDWSFVLNALVIFFLLAAAAGIFLQAYDSYVAIGLGRQAEHWVQTPIKVEFAALKKHITRHGGQDHRFTEARYAYTFDSQVYHATRIYLADVSSDSFSLYTEIKKCEGKESGCFAYVNPKRPSESVLTRNVDSAIQWVGVLLGVLGGLLLAFFPLYYHKLPQRRYGSLSSNTAEKVRRLYR